MDQRSDQNANYIKKKAYNIQANETNMPFPNNLLSMGKNTASFLDAFIIFFFHFLWSVYSTKHVYIIHMQMFKVPVTCTTSSFWDMYLICSFEKIRILAPVALRISEITRPPLPKRQPTCGERTRSLATTAALGSNPISVSRLWTRITASCAGECFCSEFCRRLNQL